MPKLYINIDIDKNGAQTIHADGDPALWPLVGRFAAAAQPTQPHSLTIVYNQSGENTSELARREHNWFSEEFWPRTAERAVTIGQTCAGRRFAVLDIADPRMASAGHISAVAKLGWTGVGDLQAWADMIRERVQVAKTVEAQIERIDSVLRPLVTAAEDDGPEQVAAQVQLELVSMRDELAATRAVLEEAIGRTPDPARSTRQLAIDLAEVLKAAVAAR